MKKLNLLKDLYYLLSLKRTTSFGMVEYSSPEKVKRIFGTEITNTPISTPKTTRTTPSTPKNIKPIDTGTVYELCNYDFHIYHYPSYTRGRNIEMTTPLNVNTIVSTDFEGPHHPACKIEDPYYKDYLITEDFVKYKGNKIIIDKYYRCKDEGKFEGKCDPILITGIIIICYVSLFERLKYYISILENNGEIDQGHLRAPFMTIHRIEHLLNILKRNNSYPEYHTCADDFLKQEPPNLYKIKMVYTYISQFSEDTSEKDLLRYIIELYYIALAPGGKFSMVRKPEMNKKLVEAEPEISETTRRKLF